MVLFDAVLRAQQFLSSLDYLDPATQSFIPKISWPESLPPRTALLLMGDSNDRFMQFDAEGAKDEIDFSCGCVPLRDRPDPRSHEMVQRKCVSAKPNYANFTSIVVETIWGARPYGHLHMYNGAVAHLLPDIENESNAFSQFPVHLNTYDRDSRRKNFSERLRFLIEGKFPSLTKLWTGPENEGEFWVTTCCSHIYKLQQKQCFSLKYNKNAQAVLDFSNAAAQRTQESKAYLCPTCNKERAHDLKKKYVVSWHVNMWQAAKLNANHVGGVFPLRNITDDYVHSLAQNFTVNLLSVSKMLRGMEHVHVIRLFDETHVFQEKFRNVFQAKHIRAGNDAWKMAYDKVATFQRERVHKDIIGDEVEEELPLIGPVLLMDASQWARSVKKEDFFRDVTHPKPWILKEWMKVLLNTVNMVFGDSAESSGDVKVELDKKLKFDSMSALTPDKVIGSLRAFGNSYDHYVG